MPLPIYYLRFSSRPNLSGLFHLAPAKYTWPPTRGGGGGAQARAFPEAYVISVCFFLQSMAEKQKTKKQKTKTKKPKTLLPHIYLFLLGLRSTLCPATGPRPLLTNQGSIGEQALHQNLPLQTPGSMLSGN